MAEAVRLQKVLAASGVGSRRHCEELIDAGRVRVDGVVVRRLGTRVDPETASVEVDGERLVTRSGLQYLALNKPRERRVVDERRPRPAECRGHRRRPVGPAVSRRPPGCRQRGFAAAHQRRRLGAPARPPVLRGAQDLSRRDRRPGAARSRPAAPGGVGVGRRACPGGRVPPAVHGGRPCDGGGHAARGPQARCAAAAGGRGAPGRAGWSAPASVPSSWGRSRRAASGTSPATRLRCCTGRWTCSGFVPLGRPVTGGARLGPEPMPLPCRMWRCEQSAARFRSTPTTMTRSFLPRPRWWARCSSATA